MRLAWSTLLLLSVLSCRPSATVLRTTPVANLQSYQTLLVRAADASRVSGHLLPALEQGTANSIADSCAFTRVVTPQDGEQSADVVLDLNLVRTMRGTTGLIQNENVATVDVNLVLSDVANDELLGSAEIQGKSPAVAISTALPEHQAIGAVANIIANIMQKSGCVGPRVAKGAPTVQPSTPVAVSPTVSAEQKKKAEALNDEGKQMFRSANVAGAKKQFQAAIAIDKDPRYLLNLCLAHEALHEYEDATKTCRSVQSMAPGSALAEKAQLRLQIIQDSQS